MSFVDDEHGGGLRGIARWIVRPRDDEEQREFQTGFGEEYEDANRMMQNSPWTMSTQSSTSWETGFGFGRTDNGHTSAFDDRNEPSWSGKTNWPAEESDEQCVEARPETPVIVIDHAELYPTPKLSSALKELAPASSSPLVKALSKKKDNDFHEISLREKEIVSVPSSAEIPPLIQISARLHGKLAEAAEVRSQRDKIWLGPSASSALAYRWLYKQKNKDTFDVSLDTFDCLNAASSSSDPLKIVGLFLPDSRSYQHLRQRIEQTYVEPILSPLREERLEVNVPNCEYSLLVGCGGEVDIRWPSGEDDYSIYYNTCSTEQEVKHKFTELGFQYLAVTQLSWEQRRECFETFGWNVMENACRVRLRSKKECMDIIGKFNNRDLCRLFPLSLCPTFSKPTTKFSMNLSWFWRDSKKRAKLTLRRHEDVARCERVLRAHGIDATIGVGNKLHLSWPRYSMDRIANDEKDLERVLRMMLMVNEIEMTRVELERFAPPSTPIPVVNMIHRRIACAALNAGEWKESLPVTDSDWEEFVLVSSDSFPWQLTIPLPIKQDEVQGHATVEFQDIGLGEKIANYLLNLRAVDTFRITPNDRCGVQYVRKYRTHMPFPAAIRATREAEIRAIDSVARAASIDHRRDSMQSEREWTRIKDGPDTSSLVVEGYPLARVKAVVAQLEEMTEGTVIDCSDPDANGQLLHGFGAKWVARVGRELEKQIVVLTDRLNRQIRLFGCPAIVQRAIARMAIFVEQRDRFEITSKIVIGAPRFLTTMREVLAKIGVEQLSDYCGGPTVKLADMSVLFSGSISQWLRLNELLEHLDEQASANAQCLPGSSPHRPSCPVCLCLVDYNFYAMEACGHHYCMECVVKQLHHDILARKIPLKCCADGCEERFMVSELKHLLMGDAPLPFWFVFDRMQPLIRSAIDCLLRKTQRLKQCTSPDCFGIFKMDMSKMTKRDGIACPSCGIRRCPGCLFEPHAGSTCREYAQIRNDADVSLAVFRKAKGDMVKNCPNDTCRTVIEKSLGCNHMECVMCGIHFCWICSFSSKTVDLLYAHMNSQHGGTGGGWVIENGQVVAVPENEVLDDDDIPLHLRFV